MSYVKIYRQERRELPEVTSGFEDKMDLLTKPSKVDYDMFQTKDIVGFFCDHGTDRSTTPFLKVIFFN